MFVVCRDSRCVLYCGGLKQLDVCTRRLRRTLRVCVISGLCPVQVIRVSPDSKSSAMSQPPDVLYALLSSTAIHSHPHSSIPCAPQHASSRTCGTPWSLLAGILAVPVSPASSLSCTIKPRLPVHAASLMESLSAVISQVRLAPTGAGMFVCAF